MKSVVATLLLISLTGCAVGQRYDYTRAAPTLLKPAEGTVAVGAHDRRPYVVSAKKREQFVGLSRGGFGNPFDVVTVSGRPFAQDVADVMARALKQAGASVVAMTILPGADREHIIGIVASANAETAVVLTINEWKTDAGFVAHLYFDLTLEEFDQRGQLLRTSQLRGRDEISGHFWALNPNAVVAKAAAKLLEQKVEELFATLATTTQRAGY